LTAKRLDKKKLQLIEEEEKLDLQIKGILCLHILQPKTYKLSILKGVAQKT
jgi:hypothetical protein